jgi:hypothetical protein
MSAEMSEGNIKTDFKEVGQEYVSWICFAQDRSWQWVLMNMVINICVPFLNQRQNKCL